MLINLLYKNNTASVSVLDDNKNEVFFESKVADMENREASKLDLLKKAINYVYTVDYRGILEIKSTGRVMFKWLLGESVPQDNLLMKVREVKEAMYKLKCRYKFVYSSYVPKSKNGIDESSESVLDFFSNMVDEEEVVNG